MTPPPGNDGTRPSRLTLARRATGELPPDPADVSDVSRAAWLAGLDAERARVEPFDFEAIRARSERLVDTPSRPVPVRSPWWRRLLFAVPVLAVVAALLLVVQTGPPSTGTRVKGTSDLGFYILRDGQISLGHPDAVFREGDRLQFTYRAVHDRLVLLSIDGEGLLTQYYPEAGEQGVAIVPGNRGVLDSSVILDDAPGPEVFVGFFGDGWGARRARAIAERAYADGGADALLALAEDDPSITTLVLEKECR